MNTGCLITRNGYFYAVIKHKDKFGNWKQKRISTGLKERGNKKQAKLFFESTYNREKHLPYYLHFMGKVGNRPFPSFKSIICWNCPRS